MQNPRPNPAFSDAEYSARLARTRAAMDTANLDLLIVTDPSNMAWLTGYDGWSFYVHQAVLVGLEGDPVWWGRGIDLPGARRTVFMGGDTLHAYDDSYVMNPEKHPMTDLCKLITAMGWAGSRIGVEMDNYYFSAKAYETLLTDGKPSTFIDCTGLVNWQRAVKSEQEITYMRRAGAIVSAMHARIAELAEPGLPKNQLVAEIYRSGILGADGHYGDYPAIVPMAPSGMDATAAHLTWDDTPMKAGGATFFEIAGCYRRYHCPQSRTVFLGQPPQKYLDAQMAVEDATAAALEQAKPGARCEDIANAFNRTLGSHGYVKDNRCGYPIGLSYPPDWGERTMSFRAGDRTVLEPGMTFHLMPALWLDYGGLETTESLVITQTGYEFLAQTPSGLVIK